MNKITELKQTAGLYTDTSGRWANADAVDKLVELIVLECADFVDSHEQVDRYGEAQDVVYGEDLLKHFGVKQ
jgi:hypothetical protein